MSTSVRICGISPPDETWKKMKAAWDACVKADVTLPKEVAEFFNYEEPDDKGVVRDVDKAVEERCTKYGQIWEINLDKLPDFVKVIRVEWS